MNARQRKAARRAWERQALAWCFPDGLDGEDHGWLTDGVLSPDLGE